MTMRTLGKYVAVLFRDAYGYQEIWIHENGKTVYEMRGSFLRQAFDVLTEGQIDDLILYR